MANDNIPQELSYRQKYYLKNKERTLAINRDWVKLNPETVKEIRHRYYLKHKEKILNRHKRFIANHPEYINEYYRKNSGKCIASVKHYYEQNKKTCNHQTVLAHNRKYKNDPTYKIRQCFSSRIRRALKICGIQKNDNLETLLGYKLSILKKHLTQTMPQDYSWDDYLKGKLHIDHIIPIVAFNFKSAEDINFKHCWALNNLQLLPARENLRKGTKLIQPFQSSLPLAVNQ